ncbi:hypothetical protein Q6346_10870 [Isoptericola sp. b490]|uniref:hypothetical protein n=1 Tax=Actinotalea lenta TaxID=3064654 RepID=UPI002712BADC|nr:hypothetical protein [Isoptericola sp. b490]MDO8121813.1 hypothetical protein [Isoptericola sp. b490]
MTESHARGRRQPPIWLWVVAGVLLVGVATTIGLLLGNRGGGPVPEAEVVTLPVPTPTVSPIARDTGTPFYDALPSTVLAFALSGTGQDEGMVNDGALEAYRLQYTDGSATLTLLAGQWPTTDEAAAEYQTLAQQLAAEASASAQPGAEPSAGSTASPAGPEEGAVLADGQEVGRFTYAPHADGSATIVWSNQSAVLRLDGPSDVLRDVYAAFPL